MSSFSCSTLCYRPGYSKGDRVLICDAQGIPKSEEPLPDQFIIAFSLAREVISLGMG